MAKNEPIYALGPINVAGTMYEACDEIKCGSGARESLLRTGKASTEKPPQTARTPEPRQPKPEIQEVPPGQTPIDALKLESNAVKALAQHKIVSVEQLEQYLEEGKLSDLQGIGEPTEAKILSSLDTYEPSAE